MAKNKKGAFGKKAARLRAAAAVAAVTKAEKNASNGRTFRGRGPPLAALSGETPANSMQNLARNTLNKTTHWDQSTRLREQPIRFISGGVVEPLDTPKPDSVAPSNTEALVPPVSVTATLEEDPSDKAERRASSTVPLASLSLPPKANDHPEPVIQSLQIRDQCVAPEDPEQDASDAASDSSEEVILFKGRGPQTRPASDGQYISHERSREPSQPPQSSEPSIPRKASLDLSKLLPAASDEEDDRDAAIDDYIANMLLDDLQNSSVPTNSNAHDLGNSDDDLFLGDSDSQLDSANDQSGNGTVSWPNGKQDESAKFKSLVPNKDGQTDKEDLGDSDSSESDDARSLGEETDDEQMARLLAKQEELGLGADELVLFDANAVKSTRMKQPARSSRQSKGAKSNASWKRTLILAQSFAGDLRKHNGSYPNAEAMADAFEQLNMTGWPGDTNDDDDDDDDLGLELSDSELEAQLKASWQNDRLRKKQRKRAREELRAQGLLGKHADPDDPRIKYPNGMNIDDIKAEFEAFLQGSEPSVAFPPMDARARKVIHEIAHRFNLTSKSAGSGDQRRPTLARKKATLQYDEDHFQSVFARVRRRYIPRLDVGRVGGSGRGGKASGRGGKTSDAVVRHGEIVGGSAPEIGQANKGRTMLEKMGWSMGMALGAMDNKGMTQPIEHVVKRSKAGLG